MMRWASLAFLLLAASSAAVAQEVVVFADGRSLVVSSHRQQGTLTYLKMDGGELAVASNRITEIRREGAEAQQSARAAAAASASPPSSSPSVPRADKQQPPRPAPPPPPEEDEEDEADEAEEPENAPGPAGLRRPAPVQRTMPPGAVKRIGAGAEGPTTK